MLIELDSIFPECQKTYKRYQPYQALLLDQPRLVSRRDLHSVDMSILSRARV